MPPSALIVAIRGVQGEFRLTELIASQGLCSMEVGW